MKTYEETKIGLTSYFKPRKNTQFEIFEFRNMKQLHGEYIDQFTTRLRQKAKNCEFSDIDSEIKSQIIQVVVSQKMRMQCLQDPDKSLNDLLTKMRTMEISKTQAANMSKDTVVSR
jgi:alpha-N-acetylglucosamine transferase